MRYRIAVLKRLLLDVEAGTADEAMALAVTLARGGASRRTRGRVTIVESTVRVERWDILTPDRPVGYAPTQTAEGRSEDRPSVPDSSTGAEGRVP